MDRHPDCSYRCQLAEHKGYPKCEETSGLCHFLPQKAWQRKIREQRAVSGESSNLFGGWWKSVDTSIEKSLLRPVDYDTASAIILEYEWLGKMPGNVSRCYGIFWDGNCAGVVVYGVTVNNKLLAKSTCGIEYSNKIMQLQRGACVHWAPPHAASKLISYSLLEEEKIGTRIVIAFSDPSAGEIGTVYQATNWLYCGKTAQRPDYLNSNGERIAGIAHKWDRDKRFMSRAKRQLKGRYIYLLGDKKERRELRKKLLWKPQPYPKRESPEVNAGPKPEARFDPALPLHRSHQGVSNGE